MDLILTILTAETIAIIVKVKVANMNKEIKSVNLNIMWNIRISLVAHLRLIWP